MELAAVESVAPQSPAEPSLDGQALGPADGRPAAEEVQQGTEEPAPVPPLFLQGRKQSLTYIVFQAWKYSFYNETFPSIILELILEFNL